MYPFNFDVGIHILTAKVTSDFLLMKLIFFPKTATYIEALKIKLTQENGFQTNKMI